MRYRLLCFLGGLLLALSASAANTTSATPDFPALAQDIQRRPLTAFRPIQRPGFDLGLFRAGRPALFNGIHAFPS